MNGEERVSVSGKNRLYLALPEHRYYLNGEGVPSVTQVLRRFWEGPSDPLALKRGSVVHEWTQMFDDGLTDTAQQYQPYCNAYKAFAEEGRWSVLSSEQPVASPVHLYAGTYDRIFALPTDEVVIADIKTGDSHPTHALQLAAYLAALQQWDAARAADIERGVVILLQPNARYRVVSYGPAQLEEALDAFYWALSLHKWEAENGAFQ